MMETKERKKQYTRKKYLGQSVFDAAVARISEVLNTYEHVVLSLSGGKDSCVVLNLVMDVLADEFPGRVLDVLFVDQEQVLPRTAEYMERVRAFYGDRINWFWVCLPLKIRHAGSHHNPTWTCWDKAEREYWLRQMPENVIHEGNNPFDFLTPQTNFRSFVEGFARWYPVHKGAGAECSNFIGIRADESFDRFKATTTRHRSGNYPHWQTPDGKMVKCYPIYDWHVNDVWTYLGKFGKDYNRLYDDMYLLGETNSQMRVGPLTGDRQISNIGNVEYLDPEFFSRLCLRIPAIRSATFNRKMIRPEGMSWKEWGMHQLESLPDVSRKHYAEFLEPDFEDWENFCKVIFYGDWKGRFLEKNQTGGAKQLTIHKRRKQWDSVL